MLTVGFDVLTFEELRQYALDHKCSVGHAVRVMVESGLEETLDGGSA